jgi:L-asparaginase II
MKFNHELLATARRNGQIECLYNGSVAVVDTTGRLIAYVGDPASYAWSRSSLKPFQALPLTLAGGLDTFDFNEAQIALTCASHSGEDIHVSAVSDMLQKIGCTEHDLGCGCHLPERFQNGATPLAGFVLDQRHNNCSGKHTGFLAYCRMADLPLQGYLDRSHPLQREIVKVVCALADVNAKDLWYGTDGCNAPNIGMPLSRLARMWARFGAARTDGDAYQRAMSRLSTAMMRHPHMYSGTGRADNALTTAGQGAWVSKTGADGVRCVGIREHGLGIALKIGDGSYSTAYAVTIEVMRQLGILEDHAIKALREWMRPFIRNCIGTDVGDLACDFRLKFI